MLRPNIVQIVKRQTSLMLRINVKQHTELIGTLSRSLSNLAGVTETKCRDVTVPRKLKPTRGRSFQNSQHRAAPTLQWKQSRPVLRRTFPAHSQCPPRRSTAGQSRRTCHASLLHDKALPCERPATYGIVRVRSIRIQY